MDTASVAIPNRGETLPAGSKLGFAGLVTDRPGRSAPSAPSSPLSGPAHLSAKSLAAESPKGAMPADDDFLVVDDVSTVTTETGEQIAVLSGETVEGADAAMANAAEKGGKAIVRLSETRLLSRSVSGSTFASMLLDQRSGILPNPFSLWRLPDQYSAASTAQSVDTPAFSEISDVPPGEDGLSVGKELSRLEASIARLSRGQDHGRAPMDTLRSNQSAPSK